MTLPEHLPGSFGAGDTLAKPVGALILLAWVGYVLVHRGEVPLLPRERPLLFWVIIAFLLFGGISALWATDVAQTRHDLGRFLQVAAFLLVVYTAGSSRSGFRTIVHGYLVASVVTSVYSLATGGYVSQRLATLFDPNYFAAALVPALAIAVVVIATTDDWRIRCLALAILGIDLVAFVLTQSRGGIVGLTVALLLAVLLAGRARPRVLALVLVLAAVGLGYYFGYKPAHIFQTGKRGSGLSAASSGRIDEWLVATRMFQTHPLGGVGLGNYTTVEPSYTTHNINLQFSSFILRLRHVAHNTYLQVAAEVGLAGLLLFLGVLAIPFRLATKALALLRRGTDPLEFYVCGLIAGVAGLIVADIFLTAEWEKQLWLLLGLLACTPNLVRRARAEPDES